MSDLSNITDNSAVFSTIIGVAAILVFLIVMLIFCCWRSRRRQRAAKDAEDQETSKSSSDEDYDSGPSRSLEGTFSEEESAERIELQTKNRDPPEERTTRLYSEIVPDSETRGSKGSKKSRKSTEKGGEIQENSLVSSAVGEPAYAAVSDLQTKGLPDQTRTGNAPVRPTIAAHGYAAVTELPIAGHERDSQFGLADYETVKLPAMYAEVGDKKRLSETAPVRPANVAPSHTYAAVETLAGKEKDNPVRVSQGPLYEAVLNKQPNASKQPSAPSQGLPEYSKVDLTKKKKKKNSSTSDYELPDTNLIKRMSSVDKPATKSSEENVLPPVYAVVNKSDKRANNKNTDLSAYANMEEVRTAMKEMKGDDDDDEDIAPEVPPFLGSIPVEVGSHLGGEENGRILYHDVDDTSEVLRGSTITSNKEKGNEFSTDDQTEVSQGKQGSKRKTSKAKEKDKKEKSRKDSKADKKEVKKKEEAEKRKSLQRNDSKGKRSSKSKKDKKKKERTESFDYDANGGVETALNIIADRRELCANDEIGGVKNENQVGEHRGSFTKQTDLERGVETATVPSPLPSPGNDPEIDPDSSKKKKEEKPPKEKQEKKKWWRSSSKTEASDMDDEGLAREQGMTGQGEGRPPVDGVFDSLHPYAEVDVKKDSDKGGATGNHRIVDNVPAYDEVQVKRTDDEKKSKKVAGPQKEALNYVQLSELQSGETPTKKPSDYAAIDHNAKLPYEIDYSLPTYMNTQDWVKPTTIKKI